MVRRRRRRFVILHFCCDPAILNHRGRLLSDLGYRVIPTNDGFEAIEFSTSGKVDALVLELDRNQADVLLVAQEVKRMGATIPTILVVRPRQAMGGLFDLADAVVPEEVGPGRLAESLAEFLPEPADRPIANRV